MKKIKLDGFIYKIISIVQPLEVAIVDCYKVPKDKSLVIPSKITLYSKEYNVVKIEENALIKGNKKENIFIPNTLKEFHFNAFKYKDAIKTRELTTSEKAELSLKKDFYDNYNKLITNIYFNGTAEELISLKLNFYAYKIYVLNSKKEYVPVNQIDEITLPKELSKLNYDYLKQFKKLKNIYYNGSINDWLNIDFKQFNIKKIHILNNDEYTKITDIENITVSGDIEDIKDRAFYEFTNLKTVELEEGITHIGSSAFAGCVSLESIKLPSSLTHIDSSAFSGCSSLLKIEIPNNVIHIGILAFNDCSSLESIILSNKVTYIRSSTFYGCKALKKIIIPKSVVQIGASAFYGCKKIKTIKIPNSVHIIELCAFNQCISLNSIYIPSSVSIIEPQILLGSYKAKVYCEDVKKPSSWDEAWNIENNEVIWDYKNKGETNEKL